MRKNKDLPFNGYPIQSGMIGESGRTLIEMLGVLAIMGLLTVVGIKTYNSAGEKSKAMAVAKQIQMMATDHRVRYNKRTSINQEFTVKGPHDISLSLKDGSAGNSENYFWISVSTDKSAFCKELVDSSAVRSDFTTVNGELEGICPGEVRFYFRKNMADKLISMTYTDKDGKQHFCPDHAICGAKSWDCVEDGYIKNESETKCIRCVWPASGCDDDGNPTDCAEGYDLYENECISTSCTTDKECHTVCATCQEGVCVGECEIPEPDLEADSGKECGTNQCMVYDSSTQTCQNRCTRVDFLRSTGTQYIDTGLHPTDSWGYKIKNTYTVGSGEQCAFGCMDSGNRFVGTYTGGRAGQISGGWGNYVAYLSQISTWNNDTVWDVSCNYKNDRKIIWNGDELKDLTDVHISGTINNTLFLFARHYGSNITKMYGKIYSIEITEGDNIKANFVPVVVAPNNKPAMFDRKNGVLYYNANTSGDDFYITD